VVCEQRRTQSCDGHEARDDPMLVWHELLHGCGVHDIRISNDGLGHDVRSSIAVLCREETLRFDGSAAALRTPIP